MINFNKSGLGQKSVGQKTFFLWKCLLGQKYTRLKFRCLYIPIRTQIYIFLNKSRLGQKSVGQKTLFLYKLHLGQKSVGQKI